MGLVRVDVNSRNQGRKSFMAEKLPDFLEKSQRKDCEK